MINTNHTIDAQRKAVFQEQPKLKIVSACNTDAGIIAHTDREKKHFQDIFRTNENLSKSFFIPASGAGSRMFQFLFDFLNDDQQSDNRSVEQFVQSLEKYAFYQLLSKDMKHDWRIGDVNLEDLFRYILFNKSGLNLSGLPKGLVPFHRFAGFILNAFQEQYMQGVKVAQNNLSFHFTINKSFEKEIKGSLKTVQKLSATKFPISFSEQDPKSHSFAFNEEGELVNDNNGSPLQRPAGHGALLQNLDVIHKDIIFIKNIDNVQHLNKSEDTVASFQYIGGLLIHVQNEFRRVYTHPNIIPEFEKLNEKYQLIQVMEGQNQLSENEIKRLLDRPIRICGMVKNEGQPGGGPFWVEKNGLVTKQIVEKAQIDMRGGQYKLMVQSKYFNPVMIAAARMDINGQPYDLEKFIDESQYFIVDKKFQGSPIKFIEKPGLWNGSMAHWNSVFVELSGNIFTPVKIITDLLRNQHQEV